MKPKVAIQIAGYLRTFNECFESWKNVLDETKFDFDYFIHTYEESGIPNRSHFDIDIDKKFNFEKYVNNLNIKKIVVEKTQKDNVELKWTTKRVELMYRKIYLCNELFKNYTNESNQKYSCILRMRGDLFFTKKINLPEAISKNTIYVPSLWGYVNKINNNLISVKFDEWSGTQPDQVVCDQFAIGDENAINAYARTGIDIDNNWIEQNIYKCLVKHNININRIDFGQGIFNRKTRR